MATCKTCFAINQRRKVTEDAYVAKKLKEAHVLHRGGLFMLERDQYVLRREESVMIRNIMRPYILSFILDIMDQSKCHVPRHGDQGAFSDPFDQMIIGVKVHGVGVKIFRTVDTVTKGANMTIYVILSILEDFVKRHGYYPEIIYAQIDGGAENANKYVLAAFELLVIKRMAKLIYLTRLPTGHTHDDIDAIFGVMWKHYFSFETCHTFEDFKAGAESLFKDEGIKVDVLDITMICPHYKMFMTPHIDPNLENLHKGVYTQHQWRFEAVLCNVWFPEE